MLPPIKPTPIEIFDRIIVLNLVREAQELGLDIRTIPNSAKTCGRILAEILDHFCPDLERVIRYHTTETIATHRVRIGNYHVTMCPWCVQILPIDKCDIPVSRIIRTLVPMDPTPNYQTRVIKGPVGEFAAKRGFSLLYRPTQKGEPIIFAASSDTSIGDPKDAGSLKKELRVLKSNLVSPSAFCEAVAMLNKIILKGSEDIVAAEKEASAEKQRVKKQKEEEAEKVPKEEPKKITLEKKVREKKYTLEKVTN